MIFFTIVHRYIQRFIKCYHLMCLDISLSPISHRVVIISKFSFSPAFTDLKCFSPDSNSSAVCQNVTLITIFLLQNMETKCATSTFSKLFLKRFNFPRLWHIFMNFPDYHIQNIPPPPECLNPAFNILRLCHVGACIKQWQR